MIGNFRVSTDEEVAALLQDPDSIQGLLYPEDGTLPGPDVEFDVDKAWHAIHYLLCGHPWAGDSPLNFIVAGGAPIGDVDVGYGAARAFKTQELSEIVRALKPITPADLKTRYDAKVFSREEIYPEIWDEPESECLADYVLHYYELLRAFLERAEVSGKALLVYLN
jgi:hypothetical protein